MPLSRLAESLAQLHHKVDAILRHFDVKTKPIHFIGENCPVCKRPIDYQIDHLANVVVRKCGCSTGKVPSTLPLIPIGDQNANNQTQANRASKTEDPIRGQGSEASDDKLRKPNK